MYCVEAFYLCQSVLSKSWAISQLQFYPAVFWITCNYYRNTEVIMQALMAFEYWRESITTQMELFHSSWASPCQAMAVKLWQPWLSEAVYSCQVLISPCPLSHQKEESLQEGQDSSERAGWGTSYASKTWSPSVIFLLLPRQGTLTYS